MRKGCIHLHHHNITVAGYSPLMWENQGRNLKEDIHRQEQREGCRGVHPASRRQGKADLCEFKTVLVYIESYRTARTI